MALTDPTIEVCTKEDFEEKKAEVESVVQPIIAKVYDDGKGGDSGSRFDCEF